MIARGGYTKQDILDALHGKKHPVNMRFKYHLLDKDERFKKVLTSVLGGEVQVQALSTIKRTARFEMTEDEDIDWLSDRIQPFCELKMSDGWVSFPLGVFLLSSPTRQDSDNTVTRDVEAYDGLIVLKEDKFKNRYTVSAGTNYVEAVIQILQSAGITKWNIEQTDKVLDKDMDFKPGREKLYAINDLLRQINYDGIKVDVNGYYTSAYYRSPSIRTAEYTYTDDEYSVTLPGMQEEFDLTSVPNEFVVVRSNPEQPPIKSVYVNDNPDSPTSTVSRGREITDFRKVDDIADQEALDSYTQRIAHEASQVYGRIRFNTGIMPFHDIDDVVNIHYSKLGIEAKYSEVGWRFPLQAGGIMSHELRRVVNV